MHATLGENGGDGGVGEGGGDDGGGGGDGGRDGDTGGSVASAAESMLSMMTTLDTRAAPCDLIEIILAPPASTVMLASMVQSAHQTTYSRLDQSPSQELA